jgi:Fe-S-cluster containining protein
MKPDPTIQGCSRCGTCCRKGGPALHLEDRPLVEQGFIHTRFLYSIRRGEPARDPVRDRLVRVDGDIIKIKGGTDNWACCFLEADANRCRIYERRPLECRELKCWDPARLERIYERGRLSRRDLLAGIDGLWELIEDHERRCDYDRIRDWLQGLAGPGADENRRRLEEARSYDADVRRLLISRGGLEPGMLDFLLGRPVEQVVRLLERRAAEE